MKIYYYIAGVAILCGLLKPQSVFANEQVGKISGFVSINHLDDDNADKTVFLLDQVELDIVKMVKGVGSLRADLNFIHKEINPETDQNSKKHLYLSSDDIIEQAILTIRNSGPITILAGKFNAPIGFEKIDPPDMYQHSHSLLFEYGLPKNLTGAGIFGGYGNINFNLYYVNGWDKVSDENNDKTVGGRFGIQSIDGANTLGFSYIKGKEKGTVGWEGYEELTVYDIDYTFAPAKYITVGAEYSSGTFKKNSALNPGIDDAKWTGYLFMLHYDFSAASGMTLRYDVFDDKEGARLKKDAVDQKIIQLTGETRKSLTAAMTFNFGQGFGGVVEYRKISSDEDVFIDKNKRALNSESTTVIELKYSF